MIFVLFMMLLLCGACGWVRGCFSFLNDDVACARSDLLCVPAHGTVRLCAHRWRAPAAAVRCARGSPRVGATRPYPRTPTRGKLSLQAFFCALRARVRFAQFFCAGACSRTSVCALVERSRRSRSLRSRLPEGGATRPYPRTPTRGKLSLQAVFFCALRARVRFAQFFVLAHGAARRVRFAQFLCCRRLMCRRFGRRRRPVMRGLSAVWVFFMRGARVWLGMRRRGPAGCARRRSRGMLMRSMIWGCCMRGGRVLRRMRRRRCFGFTRRGIRGIRGLWRRSAI